MIVTIPGNDPAGHMARSDARTQRGWHRGTQDQGHRGLGNVEVGLLGLPGINHQQDTHTHVLVQVVLAGPRHIQILKCYLRFDWIMNTKSHSHLK